MMILGVLIWLHCCHHDTIVTMVIREGSPDCKKARLSSTATTTTAAIQPNDKMLSLTIKYSRLIIIIDNCATLIIM